MAAARAQGVSRFENCAQEPEVVSVAETLIEMGARIDGIGTPTIRVEGCSGTLVVLMPR